MDSSLIAFRNHFDTVFYPEIIAKIESIKKRTAEPSLTVVYEHIAALAKGGKRIRPYMTWLGYQANGNIPSDKLTPILVAIELFHLFGLVHDDIMDNGTLRHGVPTVHVHAAAWLEATTSQHDRLREIGNAYALLVGDLLYAWTQSLFTTGVFAFGVAGQRAATCFSDMTEAVLAGQMLDIAATHTAAPSSDFVMRKTELKTAQYTFVGPLKIGLALADALNDTTANFADAFGRAAGIAFQLQDDMFDITSSTEQLAKTTGSDTAQTQHTFFTDYIRHADPRAYAAWDGSAASFRELCHATGAIAAAKSRITELLTTARQSVRSQGRMHEQVRHSFLEVVGLIEGRTQ